MTTLDYGIAIESFVINATESLKYPSLTFSLGNSEDPALLATSLKVLLLLTILSLGPSLVISVTSFIRIVIVLSFIRQALGLQSMPPNQVIAGLSLFMTFFVMSPVFNDIYQKGIVPFNEDKITVEQLYQEVTTPLKKFMLAQTRDKDLDLFVSISKGKAVESRDLLGIEIVTPAFMISEMRTAFTIGFMIYIPFLILDMVVASILMSMGMMMLPPIIISLPFKLMLFVLADGWYLIAGSMMKGFN